MYDITKDDLTLFKSMPSTGLDPVPNLLTWAKLAVQFNENALTLENPDQEGVPCWVYKGNPTKKTIYVKEKGEKQYNFQLTRYAFYMHDSVFEKNALAEAYKRSRNKKFILKTCKNMQCINPDHMFESFTVYDPSLPPIAPKGSKCFTSKLTEEQVLEIRESNLSAKCLARVYSVSRATIYLIKNNQCWKHVPLASKGESV
jgi:DNA-binding XRE family transcriptional regulator